MFSANALRILDANLNRAREALRVIEEYARFVLQDSATQARLKQFRHDLAAATAPLAASAIAHRDIAGDVGTANKTSTEMKRDDLAAVVRAAGKRLGEALRVIEEVAKTGDATVAAAVEKLRYEFYAIEQAVERMLDRSASFGRVRLYVLISEAHCRRPWRETAIEAIAGGADCLQLREKNLEPRALLERARLLVDLCRAAGVVSIINDRPDIALLSKADGVHLGQDDLPAADVRRIVGNDLIVGVSTHRMEQARQAVAEGADYIGVGPMFPSNTKPRDFVAGPAYAKEVAGSISIPAVAIGGICAGNIAEVLAAGVRCVAVTSAVTSAADPRSAARELKEQLS